jgi:hypothetical protein
MERGEVEGRGTNPYSSYMASHPTWIPQKLLIPLVQAGVEKEPELPNVPNILDLDVKPEDKPLLRFMANASTVGRPLAATPGVPTDRIEALRAAFIAMTRDPEFIAAAAKEKLDVRPQSGEVIAGIVAGILDSPSDIRERMKVVLQPRAVDIIEQPPGTK